MTTKRPITAEDLLRIKVPGDVRVSPDGQRVVFSVRSVDSEENAYFSHLWIANLRGGSAARQFTHGKVSDAAPRWSPDGKQIAFVRAREGDSQIWLIPTDGGEARPWTRLPEGHVGEPIWSPDGERIAFTYRPGDPDFTRKARKERETSKKSTPARRISRLHYRLDGYGWLELRQHIWLGVVDGETVTQITDGDEDDESPTWSPDGKTVAFLSNRSENPERTPQAVDLWLVATDLPTYPTTEFRRVPTPIGEKAGCAWSPDGRWIAYVGAETGEDPWLPRHGRLYVVSPTGGDARCRSAELDRGIGTLALSDCQNAPSLARVEWDHDSRWLTFVAGDRGNAALFRVSVEGGAPTRLTEGSELVTGFSTAGGATAAIIAGPTEIGDIYRLEADNRRVGLSGLNAGWQAEVELAEPEEIWLNAPDGSPVQAWVLKPPGFDPRRRYPAILSVHGGPHAQYGNVFFHEFQLFAARGYVVAYGNPRGSANLGETYMRGTAGDWGNADLPDFNTIADHLANLPYVDAERVGVCGGSYGGFSTLWIVGHTGRFRCAIADRSVSHLMSWNGQTDVPMEPDGYYPGNAWNEPTALLAGSPASYLANCRTPLLLVHSEGDWRCPIGQSQEAFTTLKRLGRCRVEMIWYPPETSHGMSRGGPPDLRLDRLSRYLAWFDEYLRPEVG
ncbi:MAG TPA: S9 family peptidase [Chloroflexota bacterium]|nr:S9 family peptidase [Chloroflexota bacterium]